MNALDDVLAERKEQDRIWGVQNHDPFVWLGILMEEVGEFSECALHEKFGGTGKAKNLRREAVQVAAVALALVEYLDRREAQCPDGDWGRLSATGEKESK